VGVTVLGSVAHTGDDEVRIDEVRVSVLESLPIQVHLTVSGEGPAACPELRTGIQYHGSRIEVSLTPVPGDDDAPSRAGASGEETCRGPSVPFQTRVPVRLRGLPEGGYTLFFEGREVGDFWYPTGARPGQGYPPPTGASSPDGTAGTRVDVEAFLDITETADCAGDVNMLYLIDERLVLWTRAGRNCADDEYAVTLYGRSPDDVRCRYGDTIAGPRSNCENQDDEEFFETIMEDFRDQDPGLGDAHDVGLLWIGYRVPTDGRE